MHRNEIQTSPKNLPSHWKLELFSWNQSHCANCLLECFLACQWLLFFSQRCSLLLKFTLFLLLQELSGSCGSQSLAVVVSKLTMLRLLLLAPFLTVFVLGIAPAASVCLPSLSDLYFCRLGVQRWTGGSCQTYSHMCNSASCKSRMDVWTASFTIPPSITACLLLPVFQNINLEGHRQPPWQKRLSIMYRPSCSLPSSDPNHPSFFFRFCSLCSSTTPPGSLGLWKQLSVGLWLGDCVRAAGKAGRWQQSDRSRQAV